MAAARLLVRVGLHRGELWPGHDLGEPYRAGDPVCTWGAICVARGATTQASALRVIALDTVFDVVVDTAEADDMADIAWQSDRWYRTTGPRLGAWIMAVLLWRASRTTT